MIKRNYWLIGSFILFFLVLIIIATLEDTIEVETLKDSTQAPIVSFVYRDSKSHTGFVETIADITPLWATTIKAQVNGEILRVLPQAFTGQAAQKGDLLINIEDSQYRAELAAAEQAHAEAKLNLLLEQKKTLQAERDFQRSGLTQKPSDLTLNKPQTELAKKTEKTARAQLNAAKIRLQKTQVVAPFSGVITARYISLNQFINEGEDILRIEHDRRHQLSISLSHSQRNLLAHDIENQLIILRDSYGNLLAEAFVKTSRKILDPETRLHKVFLEVSDNTHVLNGDFVQVYLPTTPVENSLAVPESSINRDGYIWYIDDKNYLRRFRAKILFYVDKQIIIETPAQEGELGKHYPSRWRFSYTPQASFLPGMEVTPKEVKEQ